MFLMPCQLLLLLFPARLVAAFWVYRGHIMIIVRFILLGAYKHGFICFSVQKHIIFLILSTAAAPIGEMLRF